MSHAEEQAQEIEVLESIYPDELEKISDTEFTITLQLETPLDEHESPIIILRVKYPPTYPEVGPELEVTLSPDSPSSTLDFPDDAAFILSKVESTIEENLGMAMVFTLVTEIKEAAEGLLRKRHEEAEAIREEAARKEEEKEMEKFRGTKVTRETFMAWREKFRKEMEEKKKELERLKEEEEKGKKGTPASKEKKLTGKQLWLSGMASNVEEEDDGAGVDIGKLEIKA